MQSINCGKITKTISIAKWNKIAFFNVFMQNILALEEKFRKIPHSVFVEGLVDCFKINCFVVVCSVLMLFHTKLVRFVNSSNFYAQISFQHMSMGLMITLIKNNIIAL